MKAICISACQVDRLGIVTEGEEVELPDSYAKDPRIQQHFSILKNTIKNVNAKSVPSYEEELEARRTKFAKTLVDQSAYVKAVERLADDGYTIPDELAAEAGTTSAEAIDDEERIKGLIELWIEAYGWDFPTDERKEPKEKSVRQKEKHNKEVASQEGEGEGDQREEQEDLFDK